MVNDNGKKSPIPIEPSTSQTVFPDRNINLMINSNSLESVPSISSNDVCKTFHSQSKSHANDS